MQPGIKFIEPLRVGEKYLFYWPDGTRSTFLSYFRLVDRDSLKREEIHAVFTVEENLGEKKLAEDMAKVIHEINARLMNAAGSIKSIQ